MQHQRLSAGCLAILEVLKAAKAASGTDEIVLSTKALVLTTGYTRQNVHNCLRKLESLGYIEFLEKPRQGKTLFTVKLLRHESFF